AITTFGRVTGACPEPCTTTSLDAVVPPPLGGVIINAPPIGEAENSARSSSDSIIGPVVFELMRFMAGSKLKVCRSTIDGMNHALARFPNAPNRAPHQRRINLPCCLVKLSTTPDNNPPLRTKSP